MSRTDYNHHGTHIDLPPEVEDKHEVRGDFTAFLATMLPAMGQVIETHLRLNHRLLAKGLVNRRRRFSFVRQTLTEVERVEQLADRRLFHGHVWRYNLGLGRLSRLR
jgi:hypothetical protein